MDQETITEGTETAPGIQLHYPSQGAQFPQVNTSSQKLVLGSLYVHILEVKNISISLIIH